MNLKNLSAAEKDVVAWRLVHEIERYRNGADNAFFVEVLVQTYLRGAHSHPNLAEIKFMRNIVQRDLYDHPRMMQLWIYQFQRLQMIVENQVLTDTRPERMQARSVLLEMMDSQIDRVVTLSDSGPVVDREEVRRNQANVQTYNETRGATAEILPPQNFDRAIADIRARAREGSSLLIAETYRTRPKAPKNCAKLFAGAGL